jgi:hypothetical protein
MVAQYLINTGLPLTFDFSKKDNQKIFKHYFINLLCEFIMENPHNCKMIFYSNTLTKDPFRNKVITDIKKIFGFKIYEGVWSHSDFLKVIKGNSVTVDEFELFVQEESKPKTFKHIKKFLEKDGYKALNDTYFKDIANKMLIVC